MGAGIHDIDIEQGATFSMGLTLTTDGTTPRNITGYQGRGQIRAKTSDAAPLAAFTVTVTNGAAGQVSVVLPADISAAIPVKGPTYKDKLQAQYDIELFNGTDVIRVLQGSANISPEVTK